MHAAIALVRQCGAVPVECMCVIELLDAPLVSAREKYKDQVPVWAIVRE